MNLKRIKKIPFSEEEYEKYYVIKLMWGKGLLTEKELNIMGYELDH